MDNFKIGDRLKIHCYKHDGSLHRTWDEATVLDYNDEILICGNDRTIVTENDGRSHKTKEPAILFFYKSHWFNIIGQLKKQGLYYYCNIASPYLIDDNIIKYIDYDLDLRVFPDGGFRILDKNEYSYHRKIMNYPDNLDVILKNELKELINMNINGKSPFNSQIIKKYSFIYKKIKSLK